MRPRTAATTTAVLLAMSVPALAGNPTFDEIVGTLQLEGTNTNLVGPQGSFRLVAPGYDGDTISTNDMGLFGNERLILRGLRYKDKGDGSDYFVVQMFAPEDVGSGFVAGRVNRRGTGVDVPPGRDDGKKTSIRLPMWARKYIQAGNPKGVPLYGPRVGVMLGKTEEQTAYLLINSQPFPNDKLTIKPRAPSGYKRLGMQSPGFENDKGKGNTPGFNGVNDVRGVAYVKKGVNWPAEHRSFAGGKFLPALKEGRGKVRAFQADSLTQPIETPTYINTWQLPAGARRAPIKIGASTSTQSSTRASRR